LLSRKKNHFILFNPEKKFTYKNHEVLELSAANQEEMESWMASFLRAGVYPVNNNPDESKPADDDPQSMDPQLERQVETIRNLVDSYMMIVTKTLQDQVPKICMHLMVNSTKYFISNELIASLYRTSPEELMEESPDEVKRREEMLNMYHSASKALKIIGEISMHTHSEPLPPPVNKDDKDDDDGPGRPAAPHRPGGPAAPQRPGTGAPSPAPPAPAARPDAPVRPSPSAPAPTAPASRPVPPPARPNIPSRPNFPSRPY